MLSKFDRLSQRNKTTIYGLITTVSKMGGLQLASEEPSMLYSAVRLGDSNTIALLIAMGNDMHLANKNGETPLSLALTHHVKNYALLAQLIISNPRDKVVIQQIAATIENSQQITFIVHNLKAAITTHCKLAIVDDNMQKWRTCYFSTALECDTPILQAMYENNKYSCLFRQYDFNAKGSQIRAEAMLREHLGMNA